jgi:hypothetical protein
MMYIYTTEEHIPLLQNIIAGEFRLDELVEICDLLKNKPAFHAFHLIVKPQKGIFQTIDWHNALPPYILPEEIPFSPENLLALVYAKLGNWERVQTLLANNHALLHELGFIGRLQNGEVIETSELHSDFQPFEEYRFCHNAAIVHHYASDETRFDATKTAYFYQEAIKTALDDEHAAFSSKHYATFLTDIGNLPEAEKVLQQCVPSVLSDEGLLEIKTAQTQVWMKQLTVPYDPVLLEKLKQTLWEVLEQYRKQGREVEEALVLMDTAQIANYTDSFAEALGYINRAVSIFQQAELPELFAQAHHRRAMLLYTWAKSGNPQFFKGALDSFKEAVKVFSRENAPDVFADIQQYLGVIYAEMPDEELKRSIWAAVSNSSFLASLAYYQKEKFPYEYAMVCNHYANALTKYPAAIHSDNVEKALFYYNEALSIRQAALYPFERAVTLLNYVEACWHVNLAGNGSNRALFEEMEAKTREALSLTDDPNIHEEAGQHLLKLEALRQALDDEDSTADSAVNH